jgi:hypothetical protein
MHYSKWIFGRHYNVIFQNNGSINYPRSNLVGRERKCENTLRKFSLLSDNLLLTFDIDKMWQDSFSIDSCQQCFC